MMAMLQKQQKKLYVTDKTNKLHHLNVYALLRGIYGIAIFFCFD